MLVSLAKSTDSFSYEFVDYPDAEDRMQKKKIPELVDKLIANEQEMNALFGQLMKALRKVMKSGQIYQSAKTLDERREKSRWATNSVQAFHEVAIDEKSVESDKIGKEDLYTTYRAICRFYKVHFEKYKEYCGKVKKWQYVYEERDPNN